MNTAIATKKTSAKPLRFASGVGIGRNARITDHKKLDSVRRYADVQVARKRALMERGKIIPIRKVRDG